MSNYDARFAVPGLMPVEPVKALCRIEADVDGSLFLCVHCGRATDDVHYAVDVWGPHRRRGVIKDPSYKRRPGAHVPREMREWAQFMTVCDRLPEGCDVLNVEIHGTMAVPVTDVPCIPEGERRYWVLCLPAEILPYGQSMLELTINGRVYRHAVTRKPFAAYAHGLGMMHRLRMFRRQDGETMDFAFERGSGEIRVPLSYKTFKGTAHLPLDAEYRAVAKTDGGDVDMQCHVDATALELVVSVPKDMPVGAWTWRSEYKAWEQWEMLVCGDLTVVPAINPFASMSRVRKYLYEVSYDSIDYDKAYAHFKEKAVPEEAGACTSVYGGGVLGRNYDWKYDNGAEFIVHTPDTQDTFAVLGMTGRIPGMEDDLAASGAYSPLYDVLPFYLVDGVNSEGVAMSMNVVPSNDHGVNDRAYPSGDVEAEICTQMLVRYVLDRFDTAAWAADWIGSHAMLFTPSDKEEMGFEHHFLLADKDSAWVIELVDNEVKVMPAGENGRKPAIANFHAYGVTPNEDGTLYTPATGDAHASNGVTLHGSGLERYNIAALGIDGASTVAGMRALLGRLRYTRTYATAPDAATDPRWDTEFVGTEGTDLTVASPSVDFDAVQAVAGEYYLKRSREAPLLWHTVHSSVYDLEERSLHLVVQEDDGAEYFRKL